MEFNPKTPMGPTDRTDKRGSFQSETHKDPTAKTDKRASVGSVGSLPRHLAIKSEHLGEVIILARDERAAAGAPACTVVYTADEIELLRDVTPDELRQVHEAKKFWNGRITGRETTGEEDRQCRFALTT